MPLSSASLLSMRSQDLLARVLKYPGAANAEAIWKYMLLLFDTPRPSEKEEGIRSKLIKVANELKLESAVDGAGNLMIRKPATPGYEDRVKVAIQAHLDMVCSKTDLSRHDFAKDPILADITADGLWIKADGTTLGADDGIGTGARVCFCRDGDRVHTLACYLHPRWPLLSLA